MDNNAPHNEARGRGSSEAELEALIAAGPRRRKNGRRRAGKIKVLRADGTAEVVGPGHFQKPKKRKRRRKKERKSAYVAYLQSDHWRQLRLTILERDNHRCSSCKATNHLQVHHLTYDRVGHELDEDLITLCRACHKAHHRRQS